MTVEGEPDPATGYVVDLGKLRAAAETVIGDLDHRNLNVDVPWLAGVLPCTENLVVAIWARLQPRVAARPAGTPVLWETPRNYAEYTGD